MLKKRAKTHTTEAKVDFTNLVTFIPKATVNWEPIQTSNIVFDENSSTFQLLNIQAKTGNTFLLLTIWAKTDNSFQLLNILQKQLTAFNY